MILTEENGSSRTKKVMDWAGNWMDEYGTIVVC
jgi:hypothetical protein